MASAVANAAGAKGRSAKGSGNSTQFSLEPGPNESENRWLGLR
jgi:hypothetical protein